MDADDLKKVVLDGAISGAMFGAAFGGFGAARNIGIKVVECVAKKAALLLTGAGVIGGGALTIDALGNGNYLQAGFRAMLSALSFKGAKNYYNEIKANGACFTAGTLVATEDGYKPIEEIEVGDYVWAENPVTGEVELKKVVETFIRCKDELILVYVGNEVIETTSEHPFYVEDKGWVRAGELKVGDVLRLLNGENVCIDKVEVKKLGGNVYVYNFRVDEFHTYFVGEGRILVHNANYGKGSKGGTTSYQIDYKKVFFNENPELEGKVIVHHSIEQQVLKRYPGLFTRDEINKYEMLRGIPKKVNNDIHLSKIRIEWNDFYKKVDIGEIPLTKESFLNKAKEIDGLFGGKFNPPK